MIDPYANMTHDDEVRIVQDILREEAPTLLGIPGIWEVLREEWNNEVLTRWEAEQDEEAPALSSSQYARKGGIVCPNCEDDGIRGGAYHGDAGDVWQEVACPACQASWLDTYRLTGYVDLDVPATEEEPHA